jgi:uncharacterized membrane protein
MKSDLIVMTFAREEDAFKALSGLETMRDSQLFGLENVVLVSRDSAGRAVVHQRWEPPAPTSSRLPSLVADAVFGNSPQDGIHKLADAGLDEFFLKEVSEALNPDSSALFIYVSQDSLADTHRLLQTLALLKGEVYHTTFSEAVEEAVLRR